MPDQHHRREHLGQCPAFLSVRLVPRRNPVKCGPFGPASLVVELFARRRSCDLAKVLQADGFNAIRGRMHDPVEPLGDNRLYAIKNARPGIGRRNSQVRKRLLCDAFDSRLSGGTAGPILHLHDVGRKRIVEGSPG